jgi:hypothetical protein
MFCLAAKRDWGKARQPHSGTRCRRQHIECERSEHISIARNASKYRVAEQHIDTPKMLHIEFTCGEYIDKKKGL